MPSTSGAAMTPGNSRHATSTRFAMMLPRNVFMAACDTAHSFGMLKLRSWPRPEEQTLPSGRSHLFTDPQGQFEPVDFRHAQDLVTTVTSSSRRQSEESARADFAEHVVSSRMLEL